MSLRNGALLAFCLALMPASLLIYFFHRDLTSAQSPTFHHYGHATEGDGRFKELTALTRAYVAKHPTASAAMRDGTALAPLAYLNQELELKGEKWRVRDTDGLMANTYNII